MKLIDSAVFIGNRAICKSYAKINLTLDVLGRRSNGYHDVRMIMQTLSLFDLLIMDKTRSGIRISTNLKYLPNNDKNIAYQAAQLFFNHTGIRGGLRLLIHKNIPVAAGLAGGSGNGAAVLTALNTLYGYPLNDSELAELACRLGADVPFCLTGGTALSEGIGEILTPIDGMRSTAVLLVKPQISVSTAMIYEKIDTAPIQTRPDTDFVIKSIRSYDLRGIAHGLCNVMEPVTAEMHPEIYRIKSKMLKDGALGAVMSGSGPTVFGLFDDDKKAKKSADSFCKHYAEVYLCRTLN